MKYLEVASIDDILDKYRKFMGVGSVNKGKLYRFLTECTPERERFLIAVGAKAEVGMKGIVKVTMA